ncbi:MAG: ABC transporter permease, partial [Anaerovoracaceae bacterium]
MTLFDFAKNNINRDKKNYIYYFVNCVFSVFVFFLFSMLSFHPAMRVIDKNSTMGLILVIGEVISIGFALCFISYSVSCFLKGRSRQLGVITILGASKKQLNRLIFMENMLVGIGSILSGILFGLVFAKMFLQVANKVIGVDQFDFYFPIKAIILTLVVLGVVFWMISYFTPKFVRRKTIVQLVKAEETGEKRQKLLPLLIAFFILAPIICWVMFSPSQMAVSARNNSLTLIPLGVTVCLMTYLIFALGMRLRIREKNKHSCNTHLLTVSNMRSGLKKNAQSMALTTILYGISFLAIILLFSASAHVLEETEKITPYAIMYNTWEETANAEEDVAIIHKELEELPNYKKMQFTLHKRQGENSRIAYMSATNYNQIMAFLGREKVGLTGDELYLVAGNAGTKWDKIPDEARQLLTGESGTPKLVGDSENTILLSGY